MYLFLWERFHLVHYHLFLPTEGLNQDTAATLECTERRIARLEELLTNPNRIQPTHAVALEAVESEEEFIEDNPFPDEVEQPFMDEFAA